MDEYLDSLKKARRNVQIADHMLTQTYPLVKDPKLLIAVLDNVFLSMSNALDALVYYERSMKRIPPFHNSFDQKFEILKMKLAGPKGLDRQHIVLLQDLKGIINKHRASPVEFARKDTFVICSQEYNLTSISLEQIRIFIKNARTFIDKVTAIIGDD